jgi:hypothetical protein
LPAERPQGLKVGMSGLAKCLWSKGVSSNLAGRTKFSVGKYLMNKPSSYQPTFSAGALN